MPGVIDTCSFCNKHKDNVKNLIVSEHVAICNECVELCQDLLIKDLSPESEKKDIKLSETIVDMHTAVRHRMRATQCALDGLVF